MQLKAEVPVKFLLALLGISVLLLGLNVQASYFNQVPGLYDAHEFVTPVQGEAQFTNSVTPARDLEPDEERLSMVQFYMATCPDCQGFSPYFKRLISDIGAHWHKLIKILVVNCNDDQNIQLCWQKNAKLVVPMIRWYTFANVQLNANLLQRTNKSELQQLSWSHRQTIEKQRRDHISLRHATLGFISNSLSQWRFVLNELNNHTGSATSVHTRYPSRIPFRWLLFEPIESSNIELELIRRSRRCIDRLGLKNVTVHNYVVFERADSFVGKTLVADWSNYTCTHNEQFKRLILVHYTHKLAQLERIRFSSNGSSVDIGEHQSPIVAAWSWSDNLATKRELGTLLTMEFLASNSTVLRRPDSPVGQWEPLASGQRLRRRSVASQARQAESKPGQRDSLQRFYSDRRAWTDPGNRGSSFYYVSSIARSSGGKRIRRSSSQLEAENINWAPPQLYEGEETLRLGFNRHIRASFVKHLEPTGINSDMIPVAGFEDGNPAEILNPSRPLNSSSIVSPKDEDLARVRLTDYYKVLAEILNKAILSRAQLDGYQMSAQICWLNQLVRGFPFQGLSSSSEKSITRNYIELMQREFADRLNEKLTPSNQSFGDTNSLQAIDCSRSPQKSRLSLNGVTHKRLASMRVAAKELESIQEEIRKKHDVGVPHDAHFKWSYCAGSKEYLRGHTCSLWVLFHTLTVHEYLEQPDGANSSASEPRNEYRFAIDYESNRDKAGCDPKEPESAFLRASNQDLFVDAPQYALANIINFVRYFLSCTNCASHFNCMVKHSTIDFENPRPGDHLLWLWEAHNRVNIRTKDSHSEDPTHPKHIFPNYEACPDCYLEKPSDPVTGQGRIESVRFNRPELIKFLVDRYRRSAILNNKIRIEELYKKPLSQPVQPANITVSQPTLYIANNSTVFLYPLRLSNLARSTR